MRTLSLITVLALVGLLLLGLGAPTLSNPVPLNCPDPSNGSRQGILGVVEVYNLDYHMDTYTESHHRVTIENRTDNDVEYKYECKHTVVTDDRWGNVVADTTHEFGSHTVAPGGTGWHVETRAASLPTVRRRKKYILKTYTALRVTGGPSWDVCGEYRFTHQ